MTKDLLFAIALVNLENAREESRIGLAGVTQYGIGSMWASAVNRRNFSARGTDGEKLGKLGLEVKAQAKGDLAWLRR